MWYKYLLSSLNSWERRRYWRMLFENSVEEQRKGYASKDEDDNVKKNVCALLMRKLIAPVYLDQRVII